MVLERVGLDPLAEEYKKFGTERHQMKYVAAPSEQIPFPTGYSDGTDYVNTRYSQRFPTRICASQILARRHESESRHFAAAFWLDVR